MNYDYIFVYCVVKSRRNLNKRYNLFLFSCYILSIFIRFLKKKNLLN